MGGPERESELCTKAKRGAPRRGKPGGATQTKNKGSRTNRKGSGEKGGALPRSNQKKSKGNKRTKKGGSGKRFPLGYKTGWEPIN